MSKICTNKKKITELCEKEQEKLWVGYAPRLDSMVLMGSIFITGTFVLLGASATAQGNSKSVFAFAAPLSYLVWLFTNQLPTRVMNDVEVEIRLISNQHGAQEVLRELYGKKHGNSLLMKIRRNYWLLYIPIIVYTSIYLILVPINF